jgi:hypothetical protein
MKLQELKKQIEEYQYFEDTNIIDISLASIIATRLQIGDPIWLVIIGASSGGKSQILRPLSLTDPKFLHRIDDLTENTFLSGMKLGAGKESPSLLSRIGKKGMLVMSDLTVLFSKSAESRATILSQFRMIYDGEMTKFSGSSATPITWKGYLGVIAGSTPNIYAHFEEVADMGERFIYYRMKDYNPEKATKLAMGRKLFGKNLDDTLAEMYAGYIKDVVQKHDDKDIELPENVQERILQIAQFAERVRTPVHTDWRGEIITKIPISAMPMRVALQLTSIAKALTLIRCYEEEELGERDMEIIDHCGWSLANEEKRACLRVLANVQYGVYIKTQIVADKVGLATAVIGNILQNLTSVGILERTGDSGSLSWRIKKESEWRVVRRIEKIDEIVELEDRDISEEEDKQLAKDNQLDNYGNKF